MSFISMISWLGYCHVSDYHEKAIFMYCPSEPLLQIVQNLIGLKITGQIRFPMVLLHLAVEKVEEKSVSDHICRWGIGCPPPMPHCRQSVCCSVTVLKVLGQQMKSPPRLAITSRPIE